MSEQPPPVLEGITWAQCACPGCKDRRAERGHASGCPCPECQPGPGIDHSAGQSRREKLRRERLKVLLARPDDDLTPEEREEMDDLLSWYIYRT